MTQRTSKSNVMRQIDENLKKAYSDAETGDPPDRFKQLLERLKEQERSNDK